MADIDLYSSYVELKGWGKEQDERYVEYDTWLAPLVPSGSKVLEIGFGDGVLLRWARRMGCEASGVEIIPALVARARDQGFAASDSLASATGKYDLICAMDVFEHLTINELSEMLSTCRQLLQPNGRLIARFPNGGSPFSGYYQASDATHLKALAPRALMQVAAPLGYKEESTFNPREYGPTSRSLKIKRAVKYKLRDMIERVYCALYFDRRFPLDPNVVVVLRTD